MTGTRALASQHQDHYAVRPAAQGRSSHHMTTGLNKAPRTDGRAPGAARADVRIGADWRRLAVRGARLTTGAQMDLLCQDRAGSPALPEWTITGTAGDSRGTAGAAGPMSRKVSPDEAGTR